MLSFGGYLKEIGRGAEGARDLPADDAERLYAAMLDGGVPDLELGAILLALRVKGESPGEMRGFLAAINRRLCRLAEPTGTVRPIVLPSYNGSRKEANLTPLLALLLQRHGVPVLVHGPIEGYGRVTSAQIFRELGILPCTSQQGVQKQMDTERLAFAPLQLLAPGLANLLALRARLGLRNSAHSLVKLCNPFFASGVLVTCATHPAFLDLMRDLLVDGEGRSLLLRGTEGEPFANPKRRPRIELIENGQAKTLFEAEHESLRALPNLPAPDAVSTANWIRRVLDEHLALPLPLLNQLAACLYASGYAQDFNQAKAVVAVEGNFGVFPRI